MVDEFKTIKENIFKVLSGAIVGVTTAGSASLDDDAEDDDTERARLIDANAARALLAAVFARAGKGKDEVVQVAAREIGVAIAAMLKEPLSALAKHHRLQISLSFELVPKAGHEKAAAAEAGEDSGDETPKAPKAPGAGKKKSSARKGQQVKAAQVRRRK